MIAEEFGEEKHENLVEITMQAHVIKKKFEEVRTLDQVEEAKLLITAAGEESSHERLGQKLTYIVKDEVTRRQVRC